VINFDDLPEEVLKRSFQMSLPTTFKKINNSTQNTNNPADNAKQTSLGKDGEGNGIGRRRERVKTKIATL
jgi:hypothetical protein